MNGWGVRAMRLTDVAEAARLEGRMALNPWSARQFEEELTLGSLALVGEVAGELVGYGVARPMAGVWDLLLLGVAPSWQRQGLGRRLAQALLEEIRQAGGGAVVLEVRVGNQPAQNLYRALGFREVGRRRGYYPPPQAEDGLVMARQEEPPPGEG